MHTDVAIESKDIQRLEFGGIHLFVEDFFEGGHERKIFFGHTIDEIHDCSKGMGLVFELNESTMKKSKAYFNNMSMIVFEVAFMLMCVGWSNEMSDAKGGKKGMNRILTSIVNKQCFNFGGKKIFN